MSGSSTCSCCYRQNASLIFKTANSNIQLASLAYSIVQPIGQVSEETKGDDFHSGFQDEDGREEKVEYLQCLL